MLVCPTQQQNGASSKQPNCHDIFISQGVRQDKFLAIFFVFGLSVGERVFFGRGEMGGILTLWTKSPQMFQFSDDILREKWGRSLSKSLYIREGKACIVRADYRPFLRLVTIFGRTKIGTQIVKDQLNTDLIHLSLHKLSIANQ